MRQLISKLIAAAISAAVVLLWWPIIMTSNGPESWALRAVAWTLLFEVILALLAPIEERVWDNFIAGRGTTARLARARERFYAHDGTAAKRAISTVAVVALVAAVPLALIIGGPEPVTQKPTIVKKAGTTKIVRITRVIRVTERVGEAEAPAPTAVTTPKRTVAKKKTSAKHVAAKPKTTTETEPSSPVSTPESTPLAAEPATG
jgi:hypothetical protein